MALNSYTALLASIEDWLIGRTDIAAIVPDFIALAESQMNRRLTVRRMIVNATASISGEFAALPSDFNGIRNVYLDDGTPLDFVSNGALQQARWFDSLQGGPPTSVTVVGGQLRFDPAPSAAQNVNISYYAQIPALGVSTATNWVLQAYPDAYLYGSLMQASRYLQDDAAMALYGTLFAGALSDIQEDDQSDKYGERLSPRTLLTV